LGILESEYQFSPKKYQASEIREICEADYANLLKQYHIYVKAVREDGDLMKQNLETNIWLKHSDIDGRCCNGSRLQGPPL